MLNKSLSVCLIVKNEEKNLARCLNSIKNIADEIIIVDTGSTDDTKKIAENFGAKIYDFEWSYDFSAARNKSIENATKDWILFLDADEALSEEDVKTFKLIINDEKNEKFEGYYLRLINVIDNAEVGDSIVFRAFRNRAEYRFKGRMHEQIINSVEAVAGSGKIGSTNVKILHYGYDNKIYNQLDKSKRNIDLLLNYKDEEKDGYYYYSLGNEYSRISNFEKAMYNYKKSLEYKADKVNGTKPIYYAYLTVEMTRLLHSNKKYQQEIDYIKTFKKFCPDFKDIYLQEGLAYIEQAKFSKAKKSLETFKKVSKQVCDYTYPKNNYDMYNVDDILRQLDKAKVPKQNYKISSLVFIRQETDKINELVKSINEVSDEVFVLLDISSTIDINLIENLGAKVLKLKLKDEKNIFTKIAKKCVGKYILKFEEGEIFSANAQYDLINTLNAETKKFIKVNLVDANGSMIGSEIRVFKNNKSLYKYDGIAGLGEVQNSGIYIHKVEVFNAKDFQSSYDGLKILIATEIDKDSEEMLRGFVELNEENFDIDYLLIKNENIEITKHVKALKEYSDLVVEEFNSNEISSNKRILSFAHERRYDYLFISYRNYSFNYNNLKQLIDLNKDIIISDSLENTNQEGYLVLNLAMLDLNVNFEDIKIINSTDEISNLLIRAQVCNIEVFKNN